jgi:hypothetical protein
MSMTARCRAPAFGAPYLAVFSGAPRRCALWATAAATRDSRTSPQPRSARRWIESPAVRQAAGHDPAALALYGTDAAAAAAAAAAQITMRFIKARDKADRDYGELQAEPSAAPRMSPRVLAGCAAALPGGRGVSEA